jgi:tryptophan synthase alpha chain
MNRIGEAIAAARSEGRIAFIPYLTAGDPSEDQTCRLVPALERCGADIVELGVPFSDPPADGEVNQRAARRALARGVSLSGVLDLVSRLRRSTSVPLVLFTYFNPILRLGLARFAQRCAQAGVDGVLVTDLPPEESEEHRRELLGAGVDTIFLLAPTSPTERIRRVGELSRGFIYYVSRTGVTGEQEAVAPELRERVGEIRRLTGMPVAVGFGISRREHLADLASFADGAVVGSALVRLVEEHGDKPDLPEVLARHVRDLLPWARSEDA